MLPIVWCPQSNQCCWVFVFQRITQAENSYPAKRIEVHQLWLVWGGQNVPSLILSTLNHRLVLFRPAYDTGFSLKQQHGQNSGQILMKLIASSVFEMP